MFKEEIINYIDAPAVGLVERAIRSCRFAKEFEEAGNYEAALEVLSEFWPSVERRPEVGGLDGFAAAEVLLRAGALLVFTGGTRHPAGNYEHAKNLIGESIRLFEATGHTGKVVESQTELAHCYARQGAYDEARSILRSALSQLDNNAPVREQKAATLLRASMVEASATRFNDAFQLLQEAAPLVAALTGDAIKGQFHAHFAIVLEMLDKGENRADYVDRALIEHAAASFHFERAGNTRYYASGENNIALLHLKAGRFAQAHEHLDSARRVFASLDDRDSVAQVDDTRARVFIEQQRNREAEETARRAVQALENSGQQRLSAEALITWGTSLARLGRPEEARSVLQRAFEVAEQAGALEEAGTAELTMLEELGEHLSIADLRAVYELADYLLSGTQQPCILRRLRACAGRVIAAGRTRNIEFDTSGLAYGSEQTAALLRDAHFVSHSQGAVLLTGETGTGKELLARLIHEWSGRAGQFVAVNCATLSETLIESQLFGHVKGSFAGATEDNPGAARLAVGGTLFLDEIAGLSTTNQCKLLRFIERGEIHTVGASAPERVDVRVLAATNRVIEDEIAAGRFRSDLFYCLQNFHLKLPPLRARVEDIPVIAAQFIREAMMRQGKRVRFTSEAIEAMCRLPLQGNARELRSLIERTLMAAVNGSTIEADAVETVALRLTGKADFADPWANFSLKEEVQRFEERLIEHALRATQGKVSKAARLLGFKHHESLNWRLKNRNKALGAARTPAKTRKRSTIKD